MSRLFCSILLFVLAAVSGVAEAANSVQPAAYGPLHWRLVGPFRAGWSTFAEGVPHQPNVCYFGAAGGGVWKSMDAGRTWQSLFDAQPASAVGALAIAPSDSRVIYVGTGQVAARYDIGAGNGVYRSDDGGASWHHVGLEDTRHIGRILIDPHNPDVLLVGALGHVFGANDQRGVFRSTDGGAHWTRTLFVDDRTGVVDMAADPGNAQVVYAATWSQRGRPWLSYFTPDYYASSAIWKSTDGGVHWNRLSGGGWPDGKLGRIGLAVAHNGATQRVYAVVDAAKAGGLYRSDDGGAHWTHVNDTASLGDSYFSRITVAPDDADTVYVMGRSIARSTDAGKSFEYFKGSPGGDDYHQMWINPVHPDHMVTASDQGTAVSVDGGKTWSSWYNQPTGQLYHLATDDRFPYRIYAGQQDNGTVSILSRSDYGAISFRDWAPVGGDERDYDVPDPNDPNIVYGSGLGGRLSRFDARTGQVQNISPWPVSSYAARPGTVKYHYTWFTPIAVTKSALYQGAQVLFRSSDRGDHWKVISPDLSAHAQHPGDCTGTLDDARARACGYGVIYSIAPSSRDDKEIWVGTDDGLVQLTRDGGAHWSDVTPDALPAWGKVASLDLLASQPGTAYAAIDLHRTDAFRPMVFATHDYGAHWQRIDAGLPQDSFVDVVRADPERAGLLYAGTDHGVFVSFDDGGHWQSLQQDLPTAWVHDLSVHGDDLVAATEGRAIWVLGDLALLRQMADTSSQGLRVFTPATAYRVRRSENRDTPLPPDTPLGENPPAGAVIDYVVPPSLQGPLTLEIHDASGALVRRFTSGAKPPWRHAEAYFPDQWMVPPGALDASPGTHRFVWNLRYPRPYAISYEFSIAAVLGRDTLLEPEGPLALPGDYSVVLHAGEARTEAPLTLKADPRVRADRAAMSAALDLEHQVGGTLQRVYRRYGELVAVRKQVADLQEDSGLDADLRTRLQTLGKQLDLLAEPDDASPSMEHIGGTLAALETDLEASDRAPTEPQRQVYAEATQQLDAALSGWQALRDGAVAQASRALQAAGREPLHVPTLEEIRFEGPGESRELP